MPKSESQKAGYGDALNKRKRAHPSLREHVSWRSHQLTVNWNKEASFGGSVQLLAYLLRLIENIKSIFVFCKVRSNESIHRQPMGNSR